MKRLLFAIALFASISFGARSASAGPIILGGDDLTDHGSRSGSANIQGWLYIERAIAGINAQVTRPGASGIAALGSSNPGAGNYPTANAGGAINSVANVLGLSVTFHDTAAGINTFFTDLANNNINPAIIWISGTDSGNNQDGSEVAAVNANAAALNSFLNSGGGIMSHGVGNYGWLAALLPGLVETIGGTGGGHTLTAAGMAAFPGLTNADVDAGPSHSSFSGNFGGLQVLATDGLNQPFILGGGTATQIVQTTIPEPSTYLLFGIMLAMGACGWLYRRKQVAASLV